MSIVLNIDESIEPHNITGASIPYFNGIRLINGDTLDVNGLGIYYGDEINLDFWRTLDLRMSSGLVYNTTYTLIPGYIYRYYIVSRRFYIYDENNDVVFSNNIVGINDFCIDFSVHKSHQFEIYHSSADYYSGFYKSARWRKRTHMSPENDIGGIGFNNSYTEDKSRPYLSDDIDNPIIGGLDNLLCEDNIEDIYYTRYLTYKTTEQVFGIMLSESNYNNIGINTDLYFDKFKESIGVLGSWEVYGDKQEISVDIPKLSRSMFPALLPLIVLANDSNNRPVYEPWLIWKVLEFLVSRTAVEVEIDDLEIYTFDLSPWWS